MDQQNNAATLNDSAGVLPMDTGATYNGVHGKVYFIFYSWISNDHRTLFR